MVMQRLHHEDLTQYLIDKNLFKCLSIPIIADQVKEYEINHWKFTVSAGTTLNQMNRRDLDELKAELGSSAYNAQYLQQPLNQTSLLFKATWIRRYNQIPPMGLVVQSWDCAAKAGINNDYSVCTTWKIDGNNYYLLNVIRQKVSYVELRWLTINAANDYQADVVLIEDKASGQQLIQELTTIMPQPIIPIIPKIDKMTRALSVSPIFESGRVYLPVNQTWLAEYEAELFGFPNCQYDDQMDSTSQLLLWINQRTVGPTMRIL
jgi:predicted phage terminase large subunit-like protein